MSNDKVDYLEEGYTRWQYDEDTKDDPVKAKTGFPFETTAKISLGIGIVGAALSLLGFKQAIQKVAREISE